MSLVYIFIRYSQGFALFDYDLIVFFILFDLDIIAWRPYLKPVFLELFHRWTRKW